ncbi:MAG: VOC family protein [Parvularculaceae bacterium]
MTAKTPRLEHANIVASKIEPTLDFLLAAFPEWRVRGLAKAIGMANPAAGSMSAMTTPSLPSMTTARGARDPKSHAPGVAHVGFVVADLDAVVARLAATGHAPDHFGPEHPHRRNVYFYDPEGLEFEFVEYFSDKPEEKNLYV